MYFFQAIKKDCKEVLFQAINRLDKDLHFDPFQIYILFNKLSAKKYVL